jgi:hypothetical protein
MDARTVVRADALFETALGVVLVVGAATGALGGSDFPRPVGAVALSAVGVLLVLPGRVLWSGRVGVPALAAGNALTALVAIAWLGAFSGFSAAGTALVAVTAAGLACLATAQAAATLRA